MGEILDLAEALWQGETDTYTHHPLGRPHGIEEIADKTWFHKGLACTVIRETDEGLIIVDPAAYFDVDAKFEAVRSVTGARLHTAIYTHGHVDHAFGVPRYAEEARANGWPLPLAIAHEAVLPRFQRYLATVDWNAIINLRQFRGGTGEPMWPTDYLPPDTTYSDRLTIQVGGVSARLRHARGETDDHTWVYFPDTRVLCPGDLFIWAVPNAGNPQKVQRYAREWALALREMAALNPAILAPGHGVPIIGEDRVREALENTASLLESLHEQTLAFMNQGRSLDTVIHAVQAPENLLALPYLHPVYDEPEFIVRNIWRFYGGWYDGMPSHLKPAPEQAQAEEIARLAGGAERLAARAEELATQGDLRLACHLADWARLAAPENAEVARVVQGVYEARAEAEPSTMAMGIYRTAAQDAGASTAEDLTGGVLQAQTRRGKKTTGT
jgi:alkyl sulfatase BDS1-like metallo-beta-lactamase superfamily hydrolase